jgi:hypothetical protein|tara:strand:- start:692 stop:862 length:171 start_codon:yes stop_codon:yes gene_type:complete
MFCLLRQIKNTNKGEKAMRKVKQIITFVITSIKNFFIRIYNRLEKFVEKAVKSFEN